MVRKLFGSVLKHSIESEEARVEYEQNKKQCLNCDLYLVFENRKGKFCSKSCSASYNNKLRKPRSEESKSKTRISALKRLGYNSLDEYYNKPRTVQEIGRVKQNEKNTEARFISKLSYCKSCGIEERTNLCNDCRKFCRDIFLFKKLGIIETNVQTANKEALQRLYKEYFQLNKSMLMIQAEFKINLNTLHKFFKKNGVNFRTISEGITNAIVNNNFIHTTNVNPIYQQGYHSTWDGRKVFLRSSYEFKLAEKLDKISEFYEVEFLRLKYNDTSGKEKIYITDFYLPKRNLVIETKSEHFYSLDKENIDLKKEAVLKNGYYFQLMFKKDIDNFNLNNL